MRLDEGAIALIDALGFRGIWAKHDSDNVLASMNDMRAHVEAKINAQFATQPSMQCKIAFLSDTIAVSMALHEEVEHKEAMCVLYLCDIVSWILERSLRSHVPLTYRGAVSVGRYKLSPHFLVGPAVDEAAAAHELANGAFVWLTPKAHNYVARLLKNQPGNTHLVKCAVPLKGGGTLETYAVSPIMQARDEADANSLTRTFLHTFHSNSVDVAVKSQNSGRFIKLCYEWRGFHYRDDMLD